MQSLTGSQLQSHQQQAVQLALTSLLSGVPAVNQSLLALSDPRLTWRGFFVAFSYWFGFYFSGYRLTPARAGARTMLD
jgi:hypothetical protein